MDEPNYRIHSFSKLLVDAQNHLQRVSAVNRPWAKREGMLSPESRNCVEAEPGSLRMNFASTAVRGMVVRDIPAIENILSEGWRQMVLAERCAFMCAESLMSLDVEVRKFMDAITSTAPLNAAESMAFSVEDVRPYFGP